MNHEQEMIVTALRWDNATLTMTDDLRFYLAAAGGKPIEVKARNVYELDAANIVSMTHFGPGFARYTLTAAGREIAPNPRHVVAEAIDNLLSLLTIRKMNAGRPRTPKPARKRKRLRPNPIGENKAKTAPRPAAKNRK